MNSVQTRGGRIEIGTARAEPGALAYGFLKVAELADSSAVNIPVAIAQGRRPGPVVWIQNAVHGNEYVGLGAIQRLIRGLELDDLTGTIVAIPVVNILAYRSRSRMAPQDGVDMNRTYPGKPLGEAMHLQAHTEIVVHQLAGLIEHYADAVLDCHDGSTAAAMAPYVAYNVGPSAWETASKELAIATGLRIVWRTRSEFIDEKYPGALKVWLATLGIPGLTLEAGGEGRLNEEDVERMHRALLNALAHLGALPTSLAKPPEGDQIFIDRGNWLRPRCGGIFSAQVVPEQRVARGDIVGTVSDFFGREREQLCAPEDGIIVGIRTHATVHSGEYCGNVGLLEKQAA